jgi:hypothetical protein
MAPEPKLSVSPELVVIEDAKDPHGHRFGVPALSQISIPTTVAAGIPACDKVVPVWIVPDPEEYDAAPNAPDVPVVYTIPVPCT